MSITSDFQKNGTTPENTSIGAPGTDAMEPLADSMITFGTLRLTGSDTYEVLDLLGSLQGTAATALTARIKKSIRGGQARAVEVASLDEPAYAWRCTRNRAAKPLEVGMRFVSSMAASRHMGYANNQIANRMGTARRSGQDTATICGVKWRRVNT